MPSFTEEMIYRSAPEVFVFGRIYGIFKIHDDTDLNGRVFIVISYYEYVDPVKRLHPILRKIHLKQAEDMKNKDDPRKRWWDVLPVESIVCKLQVIENFGCDDDKVDTKTYFIDWKPFMCK